jgi:hypothetical protein
LLNGIVLLVSRRILLSLLYAGERKVNGLGYRTALHGGGDDLEHGAGRSKENGGWAAML